MLEVIPNYTHFPSHATDNPMVAPFLAVPDGYMLPLGHIPEEVAIGNVQTGELFTPQAPRNMLMALRASFPYLPILPPPNNVVTLSLASTVAQDIDIPQGMVLGIFHGSAAYFISYAGKAVVPALGTKTNVGTTYRPDNQMLYIGGVKQLSIVAPVDNTYVTFSMYELSELPR